jgi:hypothetical protein
MRTKDSEIQDMETEMADLKGQLNAIQSKERGIMAENEGVK